MNEVVAVFPANLLLAVRSYSVAPTTADQAVEIVEAVDPVTPNELGALGGLPSWLRYGLSVWFEALVGVTPRSSELVVAATLIALRQADVAKPFRLSLTNARIRKPDEEATLSLVTCAGPVRRTATIEPPEPARASASALESEALAAHRV